MNITPAWAKLLKGLGLTVVMAVVGFFSIAANLEGVAGPMLTAIITLVMSEIESGIKERTGKALFGAARLK